MNNEYQDGQTLPAFTQDEQTPQESAANLVIQPGVSAAAV